MTGGAHPSNAQIFETDERERSNMVTGSVRRVNDDDISRAPRADRDIYAPAVDANGQPIGYGRKLIARRGQVIPHRYRNHPAVVGAASSPKVDVPPAKVQVPAPDRNAPLSTLLKPDLLAELEGYGFEHEGQTVPELREILKVARETGSLEGDAGDDEDAVGDDDGSDEEE